MTIVFRVDSNSQIGIGHVMRCLSIADSASDVGIESLFIISDNQSKDLITNRGYNTICLDSSWNNLDVELNTLKNLIKSHEIKCLIVDTYYVTKKYMKEIFQFTKVIYIDDLYKDTYDCDILINYNCYANDLDYHKTYYKTKTIFLLGSTFAPLRKEFEKLDKFICKDKVTNIMITTGGTDNNNMAAKISEKLVQVIDSSIKINIVSGRYNKNIDYLNKLSEVYQNIQIYQDVNNMAEIMKNNDIAISAGGSTVYELCACGIPTVLFVVADNQLLAYNKICNGVMVPGGNVLENIDECLQMVINGATMLIHDLTYRKYCSTKMQSIVDGNGSSRIAKNIIEFINSYNDELNYDI